MGTSVARLAVKGFDRAKRVGFHAIQVGCSQCAAVVINGVPCHETGCAHATHECRGCNAIVPVRVRYCAECR